MFVTGSMFDVGKLDFQLPRRRRGNEDIEGSGSSLPEPPIKKACLTIDLTKGLEDQNSSHRSQNPSFTSEYPHDMSNFQVQPRAISSRNHGLPENHDQPNSRVALNKELNEWHNSYKSLSFLKMDTFDIHIPGLNNWAIGSASESRSPSPTLPPLRPDNSRLLLGGRVPSSDLGVPFRTNPSTPSRKRAPATPLPPPEEHFEEEELDEVIYKGHTFRARKTVELDDGTFMRIHSIFNRISDDGEEKVFLRGDKYKRARDFMGILGLKKNEVALCSTGEATALSKVLRTRILIMTNAAFPKYRDVHGNAQIDEIEGRLICRWKLTMVSKQESYVRRLREQEADKEFRVEDRQLREDWRGRVVKFTEILKITSRQNLPPLTGTEPVGKGVNPHKVASSVIGTRAEGIKETHHTEIVSNGNSIELKETSFKPYPQGDPSVLGKSTYEATVDSRTASGRFLGHFQGTYTPNTFTLPSLCNNSPCLKTSGTSVFSTPRSYSSSFKGSDIRSPDKGPIDPLNGFDLHIGCFMSSRFEPSLLANMTPQDGSSRCDSESPRPPQAFNNTRKGPPFPKPTLTQAQMSQKKRYRFGDAFCGGGGMSSGARSAGLINAWSFDFNEDAINTYRRNFPDCETYHATANDFVTLPPEELLVDIVHLSPPCQPHSPAHTIAGKDDDRNEASLFCVKECLEAARPRMVTLEQTDGILNRQEWFRSMVLCFTDLGFSVSWKVLHGVEYGVPQTRKRLFLLAASPGEVLPNFPAPKYSNPRAQEPSKLNPPRTVRDAISDIPYGVSSHEFAPFPGGFRPSPVDFDQPLRATILASGGPYDVHPSGLRPFTPRELACLQTFPITHDFQGSPCQRKKQIGNAVPPKLAEALLKEVRRTLERVDKEREREKVKKAKKAVHIDIEKDIIYRKSKEIEKPMEDIFPDIIYEGIKHVPGEGLSGIVHKGSEQNTGTIENVFPDTVYCKPVTREKTLDSGVAVPAPQREPELASVQLQALANLAAPGLAFLAEPVASPQAPAPTPAVIAPITLSAPTIIIDDEVEIIDGDEVKIVGVQKKPIPVVVVD